MHTPGPWAYDADSKEVFADCEEHGCGWIALVNGNDSQDRILPDEMRLANARLIAAAPELLEALRALLDRVLENGGFGSIVEAAGEAIAKAEGRGK